MSRQNEENTYGFTTTEDDGYLERVAAEAAPETNFIIVTERHTVVGEGNWSYLLARKEVLGGIGLFLPELTLFGRELGEFALDLLEDYGEGEWEHFVISGDPESVTEELERVRNEVRRINNIVTGRVVRVAVESFA
jgi:hypothetical protein